MVVVLHATAWIDKYKVDLVAIHHSHSKVCKTSDYVAIRISSKP